ncbi:hypothetical protein FACS1894110_03570 [Spirochaetia bacterium]|nr:hypothetical protein FACS1894110_03570 [Spirochaetia bacterium]
MKRLLALPLLLVLMTLPLQGATISFLVIETGLWEDAKANEYSSLWENSLMEVFFEEGHIVSNSPVLRLAEKSDKEFPDEAMGDLSGAVEGGVDYFILAMLDFPAAAGGRIRKPGDISLRLYKTMPYEFLYEERYAGRNNNNMNDEFARIKQTVRRLLPHLKG